MFHFLFQALKDAYHLKKAALEQKNRHDWGEKELSVIRKLKLRFFTPREISNLLCFPKSFSKSHLKFLFIESVNIYIYIYLLMPSN